MNTNEIPGELWHQNDIFTREEITVATAAE